MMDDPIKPIDEPMRAQNTAGEWFWTLPNGYKFPSCPSCGHKFWDMRPERSIGGASVLGPTCEWCERKLADIERGNLGK